MDISNCTEIINTGIVRSLVAVAEQTDEKLRSIAIETLAEAFVREPGLVYEGEGNRILIQAVTEGPFEISVALTMSFAYSIDNPEYRKFYETAEIWNTLFHPLPTTNATTLVLRD